MTSTEGFRRRCEVPRLVPARARGVRPGKPRRISRRFSRPLFLGIPDVVRGARGDQRQCNRIRNATSAVARWGPSSRRSALSLRTTSNDGIRLGDRSRPSRSSDNSLGRRISQKRRSRHRSAIAPFLFIPNARFASAMLTVRGGCADTSRPERVPRCLPPGVRRQRLCNDKLNLLLANNGSRAKRSAPRAGGPKSCMRTAREPK